MTAFRDPGNPHLATLPPFLIATPLGLRAVWNAAPARRFHALNWLAKLSALGYFAFVAFILTRAFLGFWILYSNG
ncbi:hypothetical protein ACVW0Y_002312 [Pseudomonas sp. TE3786]